MKLVICISNCYYIVVPVTDKIGPLLESLAGAKVCNKDYGSGTFKPQGSAERPERPELSFVEDACMEEPSDAVKTLQRDFDSERRRWLEEYEKRNKLEAENKNLKAELEKIKQLVSKEEPT